VSAGPAPAPRLLVVLGPTGSGKSDLALALAVALDGEVVNCDAVQVYRGLDAATAKPPAAHRARIPHHLVDCVDPRVDFTLADWVRAAERIVVEIAERGRVPIVSGGTGLYLRGLLRGVLPAPPRDPRLRQRVRRILDRGGRARLHAWLTRRDPESAARLAPGDAQRLVRAIELAASGATWSERLRREGTWAAARDRFAALRIGLAVESTTLGGVLDVRVERFFAAGLVDEVRGLLAAGVPAQSNAFKAIGYREVHAALSSGEDPEAVRDLVRRSTRRYAKRQRTWFRSERDVIWLDAAAGTEALAAECVRLWRAGGG